MDQKHQKENGSGLFTARRKNTRLTQRQKLPWPSGKTFKILSLDGGGIRGLYGATLLSLIEREVTDGKPIADFFDLVAGTSTGGIMALGIGLQLPAQKIEAIYKEDGEKIFKKPQIWQKWPWLKLLRQVREPVYDHKVLEAVLYREFGDRLLGEATTRMLIPAFMTPKSEIAVFKTDHHPDYKNDHKSKAWEVARATSAAPTYLRGHMHDDKIFLDGGVWANNPVMLAVVEALSAFDVTREQIKVLSIGTGNFPFEVTLEEAAGGLWSWKEVIKGAMFLTTDNAHAQSCLLLGPSNVIRFEPTEEAKGIDLDDWQQSVDMLPSMAHAHFKDGTNEITPFFADCVEKRDKFYSGK